MPGEIAELGCVVLPIVAMDPPLFGGLTPPAPADSGKDPERPSPPGPMFGGLIVLACRLVVPEELMWLPGLA